MTLPRRRLVSLEAADWSSDEVLQRWRKLYHGPGLAARHAAGDTLPEAEQQALADLIETWRGRLADISWFMRCINEPIARRANAEDGCKGRFWEGRFKSQALLDTRALLQCMAYVDLNPIRAAIAQTPEQSNFTSIQARIKKRRRSLLPFQDQSTADSLPFDYPDYLQLVDWTGRFVRGDKRGAIPADAPPILQRLSVNPKIWARTTRHYGRWYYRIVGTAESLKAAAATFGQRWFRATPVDEVAPT